MHAIVGHRPPPGSRSPNQHAELAPFIAPPFNGDPHSTRGYGIQIADALAAAHKAGLVHRDLKPGNVMLTKSGAKLLVLGWPSHEQALVDGQTATALAEPLTGHGTILGTLQYMAPEQLEGKEADARTDIFELGASTYEMITGRKGIRRRNTGLCDCEILEMNPGTAWV